MAYQVLSEHEHLFSRSEGGARKEYALEATELGNRKTAQEAAEEATAYDANNLNQYTAIQTGEETAFVPTIAADGKTPGGCKGDWTNAQRLPEGRGAVGRLRVNMGRRHTRKVTVNDNVTNHLRYIYRGYNPSSGKWGVRDNAAEFADRNLYNFLRSNSLIYIEYLGYVPHLNMPSRKSEILLWSKTKVIP